MQLIIIIILNWIPACQCSQSRLTDVGMTVRDIFMKITFWGAAREVTGSKHLLEIGHTKILLDCGFFQGHRQEAEQKNRDLPFKGSDIDVVILSHAHMDHCGSLPTLYKTGFRGKIYATPATCDVTKVMLEDSADIQVHDAEYINRYKSAADMIEPIYTQTEVVEVMKLFQPVEYNKSFQINPEIEFTFIEAGHILGSAQVKLTIRENQKTKTLGFTGDLGRKGLPILRDPAYFDELDYLVSESTYGNRFHESLDEIESQVQKVILSAASKKGKVIVPAFALGRTQGLIYILHKLTDEGKIPRVPIFIDSPMANELTDIFNNNEQYFDDELKEFFGESNNPFAFKNLHFTQSPEESKALNNRRGPMIIISTSGMCEVGRIRHHLKNSVEDKRNFIMIVGFMAKNTLGRHIVEHDPKIKIFDHFYKLRAQVAVLNAFSGHAGQHELLDHIKPIKKLQNIFLVHGEEEGQKVMRDEIIAMRDVAVDIPDFGHSFEI